MVLTLSIKYQFLSIILKLITTYSYDKRAFLETYISKTFSNCMPRCWLVAKYDIASSCTQRVRCRERERVRSITLDPCTQRVGSRGCSEHDTGSLSGDLEINAPRKPHASTIVKDQNICQNVSPPYLTPCYVHAILNPFSARTVLIRQNLTSIEVRFWRLKTVPALKVLKYL